MVPSELAATSARDALRMATAASHERLHHLAAFAPLVAGTISRAAYRALMARTYGFHAPLEPAIARVLDGGPFAAIAAACRRAALLRDDLIALEMAAAELNNLPLADVTPDPKSPACALGWLYVLEGSTLGGRQLARQLDHLFPRGSRIGRRFLDAGADPAHLSWRAFCDAIETCGATPEDRAEMVSAAAAAFTLFERWFEPAENARLPAL